MTRIANPDAIQWRKSSRSGLENDCVEVAVGAIDVVPVRDSKKPHGPTLVLQASAWSSFVSAVKGGELPTD